jgi:hypothetical protein
VIDTELPLAEFEKGLERLESRKRVRQDRGSLLSDGRFRSRSSSITGV